jgi:hypothetical protein
MATTSARDLLMRLATNAKLHCPVRSAIGVVLQILQRYGYAAPSNVHVLVLMITSRWPHNALANDTTHMLIIIWQRQQ